MFPIHLTTALTPLNIFGSVLAHGIINFLLKSLVFDLAREWKKRQKLQALRQDNLEFFKEQKKRAESFVRLMKVTVEQKREREEKRKGLIISHASYGKLPQTNPDKPEELNLDDEENNPYVIDVTIPLMFLVENSRLQLPATTKVGLMGFYDPCPGEEKWLEVIYYFREKLHRVCIRDEEPLEIPLESHAWGWTPANVKK
jgi:DnaJ family protein C protein 11